jgi:hypothetical protein
MGTKGGRKTAWKHRAMLCIIRTKENAIVAMDERWHQAKASPFWLVCVHVIL